MIKNENIETLIDHGSQKQYDYDICMHLNWIYFIR